MPDHLLLFVAGGAVAGFIDSIAGGGGLITLPLLSLSLGAGVEAIATNKIVGVVGALTALLVYVRQGHMRWREGVFFVASVALGSLLGSFLLPLVPRFWIRWIILAACPPILFTVWRREQWAAAARRETAHTFASPGRRVLVSFISALGCGIYDGAFGPGGGTFMFLSLVFFVRLPLLPALAISKLANTFSAGTSLLSYASRGFVHWDTGALVAGGMFLGALLGARLASRKAERVIRPMLAVAVLLLVLRLLQES